MFILADLYLAVSILSFPLSHIFLSDPVLVIALTKLFVSEMMLGGQRMPRLPLERGRHLRHCCVVVSRTLQHGCPSFHYLAPQKHVVHEKSLEGGGRILWLAPGCYRR